MYRVFMPNGKTLEAASPEVLGPLIAAEIPTEKQENINVVYKITGPLSRRIATNGSADFEYED